MIDAKTSKDMSPGFLRVVDRAKRLPHEPIGSLARLIDVAALKRAYDRIDKNAAVGIDGITKEEYGQELETRLAGLHERLRTMRYRHQAIRRVHIPKERGKTRPIGVSCIEDKIVQGALREVLEAVYEPAFSESSYGFRPRRSAHDALRSLRGALFEREVSWVFEADIESFFDSIDRKMLMEMLGERIADKSLMRLIGKCLHVGVLDGAAFSEPSEGTVQGSILSPILGNIYLHHVLDRWIEIDVRPRTRGRVTLVRYADDFALGFEYEDDARKVQRGIEPRFARFGLRLHPDKTRLFYMRRPRDDEDGTNRPTFDFLGFTLYWRRTRKGFWAVGMKTKKARLRRAVTAVDDWCRRHRHQSIPEQHAALTRRLTGHYNYFGVSCNRAVYSLYRRVRRIWHKWLNRRSQRSNLNWKRYVALLGSYPLPIPTVRVPMWG